MVFDITEELAIDLVAQIRRLRDECFHDRVELEIASNGGSVLALGYLLDALDGFRTTDADTKELIAKLCPEPTDGCKVVHLRPPSALLPGEYYAALADRRFERRRLDPYGGAGAAAEETPPEAAPAKGESVERTVMEADSHV